MKKTIVAALVVVMLSVGLFAETDNAAKKPMAPMSGMGMMEGHSMMGDRAMMGGFAAMDWKVGTSVTVEYKQLIGQIVIVKLDPTFKSGGLEYTLRLPPHASALLDVKNGDTVSFEGLVVTMKPADAKMLPTFRPFKATVNGKDINLKPRMMDDEAETASN